MTLRENFPPYGSEVLGGTSDGLVYTTAFVGSSLTATLELIRLFLDEQGYAEIPLPRTAEELLAFRQPERGCHPNLFEEPGYAHNPVRLTLPKRDRLRRKVVVELYNEAAPEHLLRFHRRLDPERDRRLVAALRDEHIEEFGGVMEGE